MESEEVMVVAMVMVMLEYESNRVSFVVLKCLCKLIKTHLRVNARFLWFILTCISTSTRGGERKRTEVVVDSHFTLTLLTHWLSCHSSSQSFALFCGNAVFFSFVVV